VKRKKPAKAKRRSSAAADAPRCGLCGQTENLTRTECCGNWICDDEHKYVLFSYARSSCLRNHSHYTLCARHFREEHEGRWQDCPTCREDWDTELYAWYGTNEYNFEKLENPPSFEPTLCGGCGRVIRLGAEGFVYWRDKFFLLPGMH